MPPSPTDRIELSITIDAPVSRVWRAITDYKEFSAWFRVNLESPFIPGKPTKGRITYPGYEHLVMEVTDIVLKPERYFAYRWHPAAIDPAIDYSGEKKTLVEFQLEASGSGTLLRITESGFDAIPAARRAEAFRMNHGGWTEQIRNINAHVTSHP